MRLLLALLVAAATAASAQDYGREARWKAEVLSSLVIGDAVALRLPAGREFLGIYTESKPARGAVLLVHGLGVHPDHGVIGVLRAALAESGYSTLSIQMPVQAADASADTYARLFPEAAERIGAAARWLSERGRARPVLLSHSMGSRMSDAYFGQARESALSGWICMGLGGAFDGARNLKVPVLDVLGTADLPAVLASAPQRRAALASISGSRQVVIAGADHHYTAKEKELASVIGGFLEQALKSPR